jgi:hypothetical protein
VLPGFFFEYSSRARLTWCARQNPASPAKPRGGGVEHAPGFFSFGTSQPRVSLTRQPVEVVPAAGSPGCECRGFLFSGKLTGRIYWTGTREWVRPSRAGGCTISMLLWKKPGEQRSGFFFGQIPDIFSKRATQFRGNTAHQGANTCR